MEYILGEYDYVRIRELNDTTRRTCAAVAALDHVSESMRTVLLQIMQRSGLIDKHLFEADLEPDLPGATERDEARGSK